MGTGTSGVGREAFRWTEETGMVGLGDLSGGTYFSDGWDVSADGLVVVGQSTSVNGVEAFRWTEESGMVGLGDLPGREFGSVAMHTNGDGSIVVGRATTEIGWEAFIWDSVHGMRNLQDVLVTEHGLDLTGWTLNDAEGVSEDGLTFCGTGRNPDGRQEAWVAVIPEPVSGLLLFVGGCWIGRRRRI